MKQTAIPYMQLRGGSSKGLYFLADDLPSDPDVREAVLVAAMGGADARQVDGLGGADPLTSKVAVVSLSERPDADLDYLFAQVVVGKGRVDTTQNCGNILAGVAPFALETGLLRAASDETRVRIYMVNSGNLCEVTVQTPDGRVEYQGAARIDGAPGTAAPVTCDYLDVAGSACGALLPTGRLRDRFEGVEVTCIDNGMPVVVLRAADLDISGYESAAELNANEALKQRLEAIRLQAGPAMNLGDVSAKVVPKMSLVAPPRAGGSLCTRTFIPHVCHAAIGVLGAVSVATAAILPGSVAADVAEVPGGTSKQMSVEHPCGEFSVELEVKGSAGAPEIQRAGLLRTARALSRGELYVPGHLWPRD